MDSGQSRKVREGMDLAEEFYGEPLMQMLHCSNK